MVPLSPGTERRVRAVFAPALWVEVARLLAEECGDNLPFCETATPESAERIRYAVLKLSCGDPHECRRLVREAQMDWRDVLMAAGFGEDVSAHLLWDP